jgi:hypothetical protein
MPRVILMLLAVLVLCGVHHAQAHELRPGYLEVRQTGPEAFAVLWKVPARDDLRLGLYLQLPDNCTPASEPFRLQTADAYTERVTLTCPGGLEGRPLPSTTSQQRSPMSSCGWCVRTGRPRASV